MRIDTTMNGHSIGASYIPSRVTPQTAAPSNTPQNQVLVNDQFGPAIVVEISPEGRAAYEASVASGTTAAMEVKTECQTCANRKYVDVSDDSSVSFQAPTRLSPGEAMSAVASHESEHVRNEQAKADRENRRVVSQSVSIHTSICPECGKVYVSGGETRTVTASDNRNEQKPNNGAEGVYDLLA